MPDDRRRGARVTFDHVVNVSCDRRRDHAGLACDASASGLVFRSHALYSVGDRVELMFKVDEAGELHATGHVVRSWTAIDPHEVFPHGAAIEFDEPVAAFKD